MGWVTEDGWKEISGPAVFLVVTSKVWTLWMILTHPDLEVSYAVNSSREWTCSFLSSWSLGETGSTFSSQQLQWISNCCLWGKVSWYCTLQFQLRTIFSYIVSSLNFLFTITVKWFISPLMTLYNKNLPGALTPPHIQNKLTGKLLEKCQWYLQDG